MNKIRLTLLQTVDNFFAFKDSFTSGTKEEPESECTAASEINDAASPTDKKLSRPADEVVFDELLSLIFKNGPLFRSYLFIPSSLKREGRHAARLFSMVSARINDCISVFRDHRGNPPKRVRKDAILWIYLGNLVCVIMCLESHSYRSEYSKSSSFRRATPFEGRLFVSY